MVEDHTESPDAMHSAPSAQQPEHACFGLLLGAEVIEWIRLDETDPAATVAEQVGDPIPTRLRYLDSVEMWVGDNSHRSAQPNELASLLITVLLRDGLRGDYAASDADRNRLRRLMGEETCLTVVEGPCLITGIDEHGQPTAVPEAFTAWFDRHSQAAALARIEKLLATVVGVEYVVLHGDDDEN